MRADELVALASAHGIDLKRVAGASSELRGPAAERKRTRDEMRDGIERVPLSVRGPETRTYRRPQYSFAELGMAAKGVNYLRWCTAQYSIAGDYSCYWPLFKALRPHAVRMADRNGWAPLVPGRLPRAEPLGPPVPGATAAPHLYLERLVLLVLDEDVCGWVFRTAPPLFAVYMEVEERTWRRVLEPRFAALQSVYQRWRASALGMIQRRINAPDAPVLRAG